MTFTDPWVLLLLLIVPISMWFSARPSRRPAIVYSSTALLEPVRRTIRQRLAWLPALLIHAGLAAMIIALARPREGVGEVRTMAEGVALMMVVDRSASMGLTMNFQGVRQKRIDVVKGVFTEFVAGNNREFKGRPQDLIGLVTFARYPDTICPLVGIHDTLIKLVDMIELAQERWEGGTAIGDGLALGAARLKKAEDELAVRNKGQIDPDFTLKSKAIILLTDGDENFGETRADAAAQLCKEWGIKVYAIGIGDDRGGVVDTAAGPVRIPRGGGFDESTMRRIAEITGGRYWRATDGESLRGVYAAIDLLEKTEIRSIEYTSYNERFMPWALAGGSALAAGLLLGFTWLRRGP